MSSFAVVLENHNSLADTLYCVRKGLSRGKRILYNKEKTTRSEDTMKKGLV